MMEIKRSVAPVTGANRGIGRAFARALTEHEANSVYAGIRDSATVVDRDVTALRLDVTKPEWVAQAAAVADDLTIVINNVGIGGVSTSVWEDAFGACHAMEVNYFGT